MHLKMQHEGELRSDIDCLMDVLRANAGTRFTLKRLHAITGLGIPFLKKWIEVLEEQGKVRFFYNMTNEEFAWEPQTTEDVSGYRKIVRIETQTPVVSRKEFKGYSKGELRILLEDIGTAVSDAKKLDEKISLLKKSRNVDLAALGIARHKLAQKNLELSHLREQAKKFIE